LRVIDGCNAAMVEYMTMLGAAAVVGFLDGSKAFNLPTGENVTLDRLGRVLGYISTGGKQLAGLGGNNSKLHHAYVQRGQLRVIDGCNAAMVEYMTMLGAAAAVGFLDGSAHAWGFTHTKRDSAPL
jgi:hypothetical protein